MENEMEAQRRTRQQQEAQAAKQGAPGKRGAKVYHWEESETTAIRTRTLVPRSQVNDIWGNYGSKQRRYDGIRDEWDICTEFDPNDISDDAYLEDDFPRNSLYMN